MKRLETLAAALTPKRWPVRWRLAAVSATLTFLILVIFALVVGRLTQGRMEANFDDELRDTASRVALVLRFSPTAQVVPDPKHIAAGASAIRVVDSTGNPFPQTPNGPDLGRPRNVGGFSDIGSLRVYTVALPWFFPAYLQYGRNTASLDATVSRLWLFLGLGVLGGTALAALAGIAIAGRAMRPIATLTSTARSIATTRDPSQRIPEPERDDEVGELARTLDQMLRQLDAARSETEQKMQLQREFVADASHELRTPLTSILANLELLHERLPPDTGADEEHEIVGSALRSSKRMSRLVSDLLLLARADAGRTGSRSECDLAEVASAALAEVRPVANGRRLTMSEVGGCPCRRTRM